MLHTHRPTHTHKHTMCARMCMMCFFSFFIAIDDTLDPRPRQNMPFSWIFHVLLFFLHTATTKIPNPTATSVVLVSSHDKRPQVHDSILCTRYNTHERQNAPPSNTPTRSLSIYQLFPPKNSTRCHIIIVFSPARRKTSLSLSLYNIYSISRIIDFSSSGSILLRYTSS